MNLLKNILPEMHNKDLSYIDENLKKEINYFRSKRILITGGTGFFGMNLVNSFKYLIEKNDLNCELFVLSRNATDALNKNQKLGNTAFLHFIDHNICEPLVLNSDIDIIIHCATSASKEINDSYFD